MANISTFGDTLSRESQHFNFICSTCSYTFLINITRILGGFLSFPIPWCFRCAESKKNPALYMGTSLQVLSSWRPKSRPTRWVTRKRWRHVEIHWSAWVSWKWWGLFRIKEKDQMVIGSMVRIKWWSDQWLWIKRVISPTYKCLWTSKPWKMKVLHPQNMGYNLQKWRFWVPMVVGILGL